MAPPNLLGAMAPGGIVAPEHQVWSCIHYGAVSRRTQTLQMLCGPTPSETFAAHSIMRPRKPPRQHTCWLSLTVFKGARPGSLPRGCLLSRLLTAKEHGRGAASLGTIALQLRGHSFICEVAIIANPSFRGHSALGTILSPGWVLTHFLLKLNPLCSSLLIC